MTIWDCKPNIRGKARDSERLDIFLAGVLFGALISPFIVYGVYQAGLTNRKMPKPYDQASSEIAMPKDTPPVKAVPSFYIKPKGGPAPHWQ